MKLLKLLCLLLSLSLLYGCTFSSSGESLEAFSQRMNKLNENYNMSSAGYIVDISDSSLTKFFRFSENEIMLKFRHDSKNRLTEMHIVFDPVIFEQNNESSSFIYDCIKSFCQNDSITEEILSKVDFSKSIKTIKKETTSAEISNIKIEIDTTQLGTVISLYKDI